MSRPGNRPGRVISTAHWRQLMASVNAQAKGGSVIAIRDRALLTFGVTTALRVSECVAIDVAQVLTDSARLEVRSQSYIYKHQAKGGRAGPFVIPSRARTALRAWLRARAELGLEERGGALFVTTKHYNADQHVRLSKRSAQARIERWLERSGLGREYSFHDLRHTAVTRFDQQVNGNLSLVTRFARHSDPKHSMRYTHIADAKVQEAAESL